MPTSLDDITAKLGAGERLGEADGRLLASSHDIISLGMLADEARRRRHGTRVTFVRVAEVPLAGRAVPAEPPPGAGELRIIGAPASLAEGVAAVRAVCGVAGATPVSGFSLADLESLADRAHESLATVLKTLKDAGLEIVAEAPLDRLREVQRSVEAAARSDLMIARVTVHEALADRDGIATFCRLVTVQDALGSLRAFAPLPRQVSVSQPATGYEDVKRVALARVLVDNIETIQVDWTLYGPKLAQVALTFGADDVDAVSPVDDLSQGRRRAPLEEIRRNIRAASFVPTERNGRFELVTS